MTILCLALGNPAPTISLYVGGHLVRQDTSRHMVTVIHNVTADMEHVSCYADNGYGVPMQATRRVNICCELASVVKPPSNLIHANLSRFPTRSAQDTSSWHNRSLSGR